MSKDFTIGSVTYSFEVSAERTAANAANGYFTVKKGEVEVKINTSEMLFLVYAMRQVGQSGKVERYSAIASAMADLAAAASNLNKNFSLMASAFDGEYFKQSMAPDGTMAANLDVDNVLDSDGRNIKDVNTRYGLMSADMVKEIIKDYAALLKAHNTLTEEKNKEVLDNLNISIDTSPPDFPLGGIDFAALLSRSSVMTGTLNIGCLAKNLSAFAGGYTPDKEQAALKSIAESITNFFSGYGINPNITDSGINKNKGMLYGESGVFAGISLNWSVSRVISESLSFAMTDDGQIDLDNSDNLDKLAKYVLYSTDDVSDGSNGARLTAATATERKETFNNLMNKTNTSTQSVTQYTTRELSKLDSLQSMIDRNMTGVFDAFRQIAQGY